MARSQFIHTDKSLAVRPLIGQRVGFVRITEPQKHTRHYETAAWYTAMESDLGDYDLILEENWTAPYHLAVRFEVSATVTSNYHAPLLGGVACGPGENRTGQRDKFFEGKGFLEAAADQPKHMQKGISYIIDRDVLAAAEEYAEHLFRKEIDGFDHWRDAYRATPRNDFNSTIGMVAHIAGNIENYGRLLSKILEQKEYRFGNFAKYEQRQGVACVSCHGRLNEGNDLIRNTDTAPHPVDGRLYSLCYDCRNAERAAIARHGKNE